MMRKIFFSLLAAVILFALGFFFAAGKIVDGQNNVLLKSSFPELPAEVAALHDRILIADWHADNLLWDRNLLQRIEHGHVDLPRLIEGNVAIQVFDCVIKTPRGQNYYSNTDETDNITLLSLANRWPSRTWTSLHERAMHQAHRFKQAAAASEGKLRLLTSSENLNNFLKERKSNKEMVGGILAIEGLHALEGKIDNLDILYQAGFRVMGLTHFFDNEVGGSSAGTVQGGLTPFGKQVITRMNQLGIIIDLAHASSALIDDVLQMSDSPMVVSHTGVKGTYDIPRNLSDEQIRAIADKGGMIGIGFWDGAVGNFELSSIVRAIRHVRNLVGIEYVSLGSDWDGATTILFDAANIAQLTMALHEDGFSPDEIAAVMGGNQIRFLLEEMP
jgi:microsomal dipeptidase-like Zn-dependent dipeptidase